MKIAAISFDPEKPEPGSEVTISITIVNLNAFAFEPVFKVKLYIDDDPSGEESVEGIKAKGIKIVSFKVKLETGKYQIKAVIDPGIEMEKNAFNNIEVAQIIVVASEDREELEKIEDLSQYPDLICLDIIKPSQFTLVPEETVVFYALFRNLWDEKVEGPFHASWTMNEKVVARIRIKNFPPRINWKFGMLWNVKNGKYRIKAIIDDKNVIKEKDDKNNNTCKTYISIRPRTNIPIKRNEERIYKRFSYSGIEEDIGVSNVSLESIKIEAIESPEAGEGLYRISYSITNRSSEEVKDISVTLTAAEHYIHSFYIKSLTPGEVYKIPFIDKIAECALNISIDFDGKTLEHKGSINLESVVKTESEVQK
jgi:hypothetical protein